MIDNYAIADQFSLLSKLMDIHEENSFKAKSYSSAAFAIEKTLEQFAEIPRNKIFSLRGIGESTGKKIIEILDTGKLEALELLLEKTPEGILEMMQIKGLGPKKISTIWKAMGIENVGELLYACNENRLLLYKGFGEKTQKNVADSIEFYFKHQGHFLYQEVEEYATNLDSKLKAEFGEKSIASCGEFVRQIPTIEKLTWVCSNELSAVKSFLIAGNFQLIEESEKEIQVKGEENITIIIQEVSAEEFQIMQFRKNCSEIFLQEWESKYPFNSTVYQSQKEIFDEAGINYIPAFLREDPAVIERYKNQQVPTFVQSEDVKSIIHSHSNWSDGTNTIEEMAKECIRKGLEYLVISDHSNIAFYANGLNEEKVKEQHRYIDELNAKYAPFRIFKSIECDILNDGSLDYSEDFLNVFDLVIASVHSNLKMNQEKAMQRLLAAIENPFTSILGHPTGRLLLSRKGYPIDHETIIEACVENDVVIEINAHPRRLDLDWSWVSKAQEKGAMLSINPDAHNITGFNDIRYGVLAAQKGGLLKENNLSSFSLDEFEQFLVNQHQKRG
jgi:DNA polymerase (family 10)